MHMNKRLLILGAGANQLPAILRAVDLGLFVITADYMPENVGHRFSNQSIDCSTVDKAGILAAAKELDIDGIATVASDVATATVAFVADHLRLPGCSVRTAEVMSNKAKFRSAQQEHGLSSPAFAAGQEFSEIEKSMVLLSPPLMFKPVDASGSRGISRVDRIDRQACMEAFHYARSYSRSNTVCVEEFIEGIEVGGDGFLLDGRLQFAAITHKHKSDYVVTGHSLPTNISDEDQQRVLHELDAICRAVGHTEGPLNFDVVVSADAVTVLEMSPRLGGNGIPEIIARGTAVDLIAAILWFSLGEEFELPPCAPILRPCGSWVFGSEHAGRLVRIASEPEMMASLPQVFKHVTQYDIGDEVPAFDHNGNSLGYTLFDCPPSSSYRDMVGQVQNTLGMLVARPNTMLQTTHVSGS